MVINYMNYPPTERQLKCIKFINDMLGKKFSPSNIKDASKFIATNQPEATRVYNERYCGIKLPTKPSETQLTLGY